MSSIIFMASLLPSHSFCYLEVYYVNIPPEYQRNMAKYKNSLPRIYDLGVGRMQDLQQGFGRRGRP